jgi:hypothetical protein
MILAQALGVGGAKHLSPPSGVLKTKIKIETRKEMYLPNIIFMLHFMRLGISLFWPSLWFSPSLPLFS